MPKVTRPPLVVVRKTVQRAEWPLLGPDADKEASGDQSLKWLIFADGHVERDTLDYNKLREAYCDALPRADYAAMNKWTPWMELDKIYGAGEVVGLGGYHYCDPINAWKTCITDRAYNAIEFAGITLEQAWNTFISMTVVANSNARGGK